MGKASSSKKVARAARAGGKASADQRKLGFPAAVVAVMVIGVGLVVFSRSERTSADVSPTLDDHWHYAYGIYTCDDFAESLADAGPDENGIHTHDDGIIHIHPFSSAVTGPDATFGEFADMTGVTLEDDSFTLPDGTTFADGDDCGGEPGRVVLARWPADDPDADPVLFEDDFRNVRFTEDRGVITLAFLPEGAEVPRPPSVPGLDNLSDVEGASTTTTVPGAGGDTSTTVAGDPAATSVPADDTATTAPADAAPSTSATSTTAAP